ncbi:N-6 DNA methylase, partial [bacterium]|nr:N-6 DNA methylase [bacterium]
MQTKTKQRVKDFGEVFTNKREIINMLSLIDNSSKNFSKLKDTIILEPTCGNGNFIIEIAKRKLDFYSSEEDQKEALSTIYGTDIQEDNILETRSRLRELVDFDIEDILHSNFFVSNFLEYDFSKKLNKIDIVIGNPPYQTDDNGHGASSSPIYNLFIDKIRNELKPTYFSFIIPSRWMTGGKGLAKFRHTMLNDTKFEVLVDFKNDKDCFPTVSIEGGVCYFLWNINYEGLCSYIEMDDDQIISKKNRNLKEYDIFIRDNQSISILKKVISKTEDFL